MMEAVFFLGVFGLGPGLAAWATSGRGGWRFFVGVVVVVFAFGCVVALAPDLIGARDDAQSAEARKWVGYAALPMIFGQTLGRYAGTKWSPPAVGVGVAILGLAIGAGLIGFGVI